MQKMKDQKERKSRIATLAITIAITITRNIARIANAVQCHN